MHEESIVHRALALGAIAFAFLGGVPIAQQYAPPVQRAVPALVVTDEESSQQAAPPERTSASNEPVAGSPPHEAYRVLFSGPAFSKTVDLSIPNPMVGSLYAGGVNLLGDMNLYPIDGSLEGMEISFQPQPEAPHFVLNANAEFLKDMAFSWAPRSLDLGGLKVNRIQITPAPVLTLNPAPQQIADQSKEQSPETPVSVHTILDEISSCITIFGTAAELIRKSRKSETREPSSPAVKQVALGGDAVRLTTADGAQHTVITKADVENLDDSDRRLILTLSASIRNHFNLWAAGYPDRDASADAAAKSGALQHSLCADLSRLRGYIERTGRQLSGFEAIEVVCQG